MRTRIVLVLFLAVASPRNVCAQDASGGVGKRVILQFGSVLREGDQVVDDQKLEPRGRGGLRANFRVYKVEQVSGPRLRLRAEEDRVVGWVQAAEVIAYDQAIEYFTHQIRANPANGDAYTCRGSIWRDQKKIDLALADFAEAIRLDPGSEVCWTNRGNAWHDKKEYDKAIADYSEAIRIDPKNPAAYYNRGNAWFNKNGYDNAIADYTERIRIDPKFAVSYINRGSAWRAKKEYEKALADFDQAIKIEPRNGWFHFNWAVTYFVSRRDGATDGLKRVLELEDGKGEISIRAVILGHLAARIGKDEGLAKEFLGPLAAKLDAARWPYPIVRYLRSELDEPVLLRLATDADKRAEARCYIGLDLLAKGQKESAIEHLRWVNKHGNPALTPHAIAFAELDRAGVSGAKSGERPSRAMLLAQRPLPSPMILPRWQSTPRGRHFASWFHKNVYASACMNAACLLSAAPAWPPSVFS